MIEFLVKGVVIGFSIAAPVGPIGMLCIRRTLADGRAAGLGAATADSLYGLVAGFGLTVVSSALVNQSLWLRLLGGAFLLFLGVKTFLEPPASREAKAGGRGLVGAYTSTLFLTLTNPMTIFSFAAIFAGMGLASGGSNFLGASALVLGVFVGSALWWLLLSGGMSLLRARLSARGLRWVNRLSGIIIVGFGLVALLSILA